MNNITPQHIHEEVIRGIRLFFIKYGFQEFTLPVLKSSLPLEPNIHALSTKWHTPKGVKSLYLSTSPESGLKKIIANGADKCFSLTKSFRNIEGSGPHHQPEFLMLEWYKTGSNFQDIMKDCQKLIRFLNKHIDGYLNRRASSLLSYQSHTIDLAKPWPTYSLIELFTKYTNISLTDSLDDENMASQARKRGYTVTNENSFDQLFDQIFLNEIAPHLPLSAYFLVDFPSKISPLCLPQKNNIHFAERFELFMGGIEIGNGNSEYTNVFDIKYSFDKEQRKRKALKIESSRIDEDLLNALYSLKNTTFAGMGIGVERLSMLFSNSPIINDVLYFPIADMINNNDPKVDQKDNI